VTDMGWMFAESKINQPSVGHLNTSHVRDMGGMFKSSQYNHPLFFDTSNVVNMSYMFYDSQYNHPLHFDTSNVKHMLQMFTNSKFNHPLRFDTSSAIDMSYMFADAEYSHPLDSFDFSKVLTIEKFFEQLVYVNRIYIHPIKQIDTLSRDINGYTDIAAMDARNRRLKHFLETGEVDDIEALMNDFMNNEEILIMIKHAQLERSFVSDSINEKDTTPVYVSKIRI